MSVKRSAISSLVVFVLVSGTAVAGTMTARAATPECGPGCIALADLEFGPADLTAVAGLHKPVILSPKAPVATEDWQLTDKGSVPNLFAQGLVTAEMNTLFPEDEGYEVQYTPDGVASGRCLGLRAAARNHERVRLEPCGAGQDTIWIADQADREGRYEPLVPGSDTVPAGPVLTGGNIGTALTVQTVSLTGGVVSSDQVWQAVFGVQS